MRLLGCKLILLTPILMFSLDGCVNVQEANVQSQAATEAFHTRFNDERFDEIHDAADSEFQKATTRTQLEALLAQYRALLGPFQRATRAPAFEMSRSTRGTFVALTIESAFVHGSARNSSFGGFTARQYACGSTSSPMSTSRQ